MNSQSLDLEETLLYGTVTDASRGWLPYHLAKLFPTPEGRDSSSMRRPCSTVLFGRCYERRLKIEQIAIPIVVPVADVLGMTAHCITGTS